MNWNLLSISDLSREEIDSILVTARKDFLELSRRDIKKVPTLRGRTIIDLFFEKSTRTSTSFELAGKRLSADVINVKADSSAVGKGESLKDTVLTLNAYRPDILVVRHPHVGAPAFMARYTQAHVVNAGDGKGEHPTQCLLDIFSLKQTYGELDGLKVAIVGDILHSRVARSNIAGFRKMGMQVRLIAPPALLPRGVESLGAEVSHTLDDLKKVDVIYLLRMQKERHEGANYLPSLREYISHYCVGRRHVRPDQRVLHPGPINRGVEIESELADADGNMILQQVEAGLAVRMAVLYRIIIDNAATAGSEVRNIQAVG
ncbi:MAG: aspartate carbamoyltransferase catalytic subunit [Actinomycetota bacterium]|nr:aspartate carbamoyltransferase catalytic subunit [Actinomycetota bacterium]MCL6092437.1 aspartate carbamoyltransferase catalytic subunit [Actinomycetota bacterium]MDA8167141.1 aspartate carbamoyltransferase catalytic subunit [Actinomycetota bacterium]